MEELIRGAIDPASSSEGGLTDIWPDTPGTPPINPNPESWPVLGDGPFPPRPNGTPPHLLDPSTPSPLLVLFDPVGEISPEQVANDIVTGAAAPVPNQDTVHAVGDALGAAVTDQARTLAAQNTGQLRHVDVAALPPEEQTRLTQALSGAGQGVSHADQAVGGDTLGAAVPPHSDLHNRALRHQRLGQAQRHTSDNPGTEFLPRQQADVPLPSSQVPAPPSTGNPIADRGIQFAQASLRMPVVSSNRSALDPAIGADAIASTLERLTGKSNNHLRRQAMARRVSHLGSISERPLDQTESTGVSQFARQFVVPEGLPISPSLRNRAQTEVEDSRRAELESVLGLKEAIARSPTEMANGKGDEMLSYASGDDLQIAQSGSSRGENDDRVVFPDTSEFEEEGQRLDFVIREAGKEILRLAEEEAVTDADEYTTFVFVTWDGRYGFTRIKRGYSSYAYTDYKRLEKYVDQRYGGTILFGMHNHPSGSEKFSVGDARSVDKNGIPEVLATESGLYVLTVDRARAVRGDKYKDLPDNAVFILSPRKTTNDNFQQFVRVRL